jgi:flagellar FliJ protein
MFRFGLEKILDYRVQLEEQAKMELAKALAAHRAREKAAAALRQAMARHATALEGKKDLTVADIWLWQAYGNRLRQDTAVAESALRQAAEEVSRRRAVVVARSTERKLLEKLKAKQAARHAREEGLKEQKQHDEMAVVRHDGGHAAGPGLHSG